jgi:hypothetical protein
MLLEIVGSGVRMTGGPSEISTRINSQQKFALTRKACLEASILNFES